MPMLLFLVNLYGTEHRGSLHEIWHGALVIGLCIDLNSTCTVALVPVNDYGEWGRELQNEKVAGTELCVPPHLKTVLTPPPPPTQTSFKFLKGDTFCLAIQHG